MLPIVSDSMSVQKLSIFNASVLPRNPLNGARLKNTTGKHLLGGPITVLDGNTYAGDAQIADMTPNQGPLHQLRHRSGNDHRHPRTPIPRTTSSPAKSSEAYSKKPIARR